MCHSFYKFHFMKKTILSISLFFYSLLFYGQSAEAVFSKETFATSLDRTLNYRKLEPIEKKDGEKYPLVLFLHGAGERGNDNKSQLVHGGNLFAKTANRQAYPAYVLFPQCPSDCFWAFPEYPASFEESSFPVNYPMADGVTMVKELLDSYLAQDDIDLERIYLVGISMGGMGTYDLVCRFPEVFAAAVPICGGINVKRIHEGMTSVYWRVIHGNADSVVPVGNSVKASNALKAMGANVEYIEYPGVGHESWNNAFGRADFLSWVFEKRKLKGAGVHSVSAEASRLEVYPNPLTEGADFKVNASGKLIVYTLQGSLIIEKKVTEDSATSLPRGVYIVELSTEDTLQRTKLIVE